MQGMDLSQGVGAAVPDWDDVRLLAPHAELRLLACGQASLLQSHRLRSASTHQHGSHNSGAIATYQAVKHTQQQSSTGKLQG